MSQITIASGTGSVNTTSTGSSFATAGTGHNYVLFNALEFPVRITVESNNLTALTLDPIILHPTATGARADNSQVPRDNSFTLDANSGTLVHVQANTVSGAATARTVKFTANMLHTERTFTTSGESIYVGVAGGVVGLAI